MKTKRADLWCLVAALVLASFSRWGGCAPRPRARLAPTPKILRARPAPKILRRAPPKRPARTAEVDPSVPKTWPKTNEAILGKKPLVMTREVNDAIELADGGNLKGAEKVVRRYLGKNPDDISARVCLSLILERSGRLEASAKVVEAGLGKRPSDYILWIRIARVRRQQAIDGPNLIRKPGSIQFLPGGNPAEEAKFRKRHWMLVVKAYKGAIRCHRNSFDAWVGLAEALTATGQHRQAIAAWRGMVRQIPTNADLWLGLAGALRAAGMRKAEMARAYEKVLDIDPRRKEAYRALAIYYRKTGRIAKAESYQNKAFFYAWLPPFLRLCYSDALVKQMETLAGRDPKAKAALVRKLSRDMSKEAAYLLAGLCWHHSDHGTIEETAFSALEARRAVSELKLLVKNARSVCTIRQAVVALARLKAPGMLSILTRMLPSDHGYFPMGIPSAMVALDDPKAVPHLIKVIQQNVPETGKNTEPDDWFAADRLKLLQERAAAALGHFKTAESTKALKAAAAKPHLTIICLVSLYAHTHDPSHLRKATRVFVKDRKRLPLGRLIRDLLKPIKTAAARRFLKQLKKSRIR